MISLILGLNDFHVVGDEVEPMRISRGDRSAWQSVRALAAPQREIAVRVPEAETLLIPLPHMPRTASELRGRLANASPILPGELAWTAPRATEHGAEVIVVRRAWLDPRIAEIEAALPQSLRVIVEPTGAPLAYRSPATRRRVRTTAVIVSAALLIGITALAVGANMSRSPRAREALPSPTSNEAPGIADTLLDLSTPLPPSARLVEIARQAGALTITVETRDTASLFAADGFRLSWRDVGGARRTPAGYRAVFALVGPPARSSARPASALSAISRAEGEQRALAGLRATESDPAVDMQLTALPGTSSDPLEFALTITGPQAGVLALADRIESGLPAARFVDWRLRPDSAGVRLNGTVAVIWFRTR